jgi:dipeptidyl-peptidase III
MLSPPASVPADLLFPARRVGHMQVIHMIRLQTAPLLAALFAMTLAGVPPRAFSQDKTQTERRTLAGQAGPIAIVQYYADGFEQLTPQQRVLAYYLSQAGIAGDPIYYDQISPYGLELKQLLEGIWTHPSGIDAGELKKIQDYTQLFWIQHGNYNLDSSQKFLPEFTPAELHDAAHRAFRSGANFGVRDQKGLDALLARLQKPIFDATDRPMLTVKSPPAGQDLLTASGNNYYENVTLADLENFDERYTLNSRVEKRGGKLFEDVWRAGTPDGKVPPGRYAAYIERIIANLTQAAGVADPAQADVLRKLIHYYQTGESADWRAYSVAWVQLSAKVDAIDGFIETYMDARTKKGGYESMVSFVDPSQTQFVSQLAANAQYFEDRAPWADAYKKQGVRPPSAKFIIVVSEAGDAGPISFSGVNLPNEQDIRQVYGTKSMILSNITSAFAEAVGHKAADEFSSSDDERERAHEYGEEARRLMVAMHEVLGHGSGKVSDSLMADPRSYLKEYYSTLEESRADLVALWDFTDPKLAELGVKNQDELMRAAYDAEARAGLILLNRYPQGGQVIEDHDRGTQMIVHYLMDKYHCIEPVTVGGKLYLRVNDYAKMHEGVGALLAELMRIKAEGDYAGIRSLVNTYGVNLDPAWRDEVVRRARGIDLPTHGAFLSPIIGPIRDAAHHVVDAKIRYPADLADVMLTYSRESLGYLPAQ